MYGIRWNHISFMAGVLRRVNDTDEYDEETGGFVKLG